MPGIKLGLLYLTFSQRKQNTIVIAPNVPALMLLPIHLGFDDRLLFNASPVGPFLLLILLDKEKVPGYFLCRGINTGALSGKVEVRLRQVRWQKAR